MGRSIYVAPLGLHSKWIRCQDETGYPERVLHVIERFLHTRKALSLGPYSFLSPASTTKHNFSVRGRTSGIASLWSTGSAHGTDMGQCTARTEMSSSPFRHFFALGCTGML